MPVIQITYDVPLDIAKGMASGELRLLGTAALRNSTGIAAHIREVSRTIGGDKSTVATSLAKGLKNPKVVVFGLGVVAVGSGIAGWIAGRRRQVANHEVPACVDQYNNSLGAYLEAIGNGELSEGLLVELISSLEAVKESSDSGRIALEFSIDESSTLVRLVSDYTRKLAEANSVEVSMLEEPASPTPDSSVIHLSHYLEMQRQIFERSA